MKKFVRETSQATARRLIHLANLTKDVKTILEPSAGNGKIIDEIYKIYPNNDFIIDCIELNEGKCKELESKCYGNSPNNIFHGDFLEFSAYRKYDRIIACPPFKQNVDLVHIQKMYELLENKGIMVSLTSPYWVIHNEPHHIAFRSWLEDKNYSMELLPDNSFMENDKTVSTMILRIVK